MTIFGALREGDPFFLFIAAISLLYGLQAVNIARRLRQLWPTFRTSPLDPAGKALADRAAFYVGIPPGVFVHEVGHALLVWLYGGTIVDVGYGFYWGYVAHFGRYSAAESWWISMAGTLGSLLYTAAIALWWRQTKAPGPRYLLLSTLRINILFAILYYPILTAITAIGDWQIIYDFGRTPLLSTATAVVHAVALLAYWRASRAGAFEGLALDPKAEAALAALGPVDDFQALDGPTQLALARIYLRGGAVRRAERLLRHHRTHFPASADGALLLAHVMRGRRRELSPAQYALYDEALSLGLNDPIEIASANLALGLADLERNRLDKARSRIDAGLAALARTEGAAKHALRARLLWQQMLLSGRKGRSEEARQALSAAYESALLGDDRALLRTVEAEMARVEPGFVPRQPSASP